MTIKTFKCVICEAEVSKPQSYLYLNGRACRHHPEVQEAHEVSENSKVANLEKHKLHIEERQEFGFSEIKNPNGYCWCCKKDGLYAHLVYERLAINLAKSRLEGTQENVFDPEATFLKKTRDEVGTIVLKRFPIPLDYPEWKLKQLFKGDPTEIQISRLSEVAVICYECANEFGFDWNYNKPKFEDAKKQFETMVVVGSIMKPMVDAIAAGEIASDMTRSIMKIER